MAERPLQSSQPAIPSTGYFDQTFVEKMMLYLQTVLDQGQDGLLLDNVSESRVECYGNGMRGFGCSSRYKTVRAESPAVNVPVHTHLSPG